MSARKRYPRDRKPIIYLICEGRNESEKLFFKHFVNKGTPYNLYIKNSEATDVLSMGRLAERTYKDNELSRAKNKDHVFCLVDLDLDADKYQKYITAKKRYKNVEFIVSNPCFEVWLQYYFTPHPKSTSSSQKTKDALRKHIKNYSENMDVIQACHLEEKHSIAIDYSKKQNDLISDRELLDRNPYTEIQDVLVILFDLMESNS